MKVVLVSSSSGEVLKVESATGLAELIIPPGYDRFFYFPDLHDRTGYESARMLQAAIDRLGERLGRVHEEPTMGNVGFACRTLLGWATKWPQGVWRVR